jgi:hypothetical protein
LAWQIEIDEAAMNLFTRNEDMAFNKWLKFNATVVR